MPVKDAMTSEPDHAACELCNPADVVMACELAYARYDNHSLSPGHLLIVPRRHVASFFDMTLDEQTAIVSLLSRAQRLVQSQHSPDGYNIGVNVGKAGGQARMHVHVHLIPRYTGDVPDPSGGIRCVLSQRTRAA
jgi:diadenosine tetraphosphate (Ap4A) HIT family hydrolase/GNAT superfamily N-acetyltransferase